MTKDGADIGAVAIARGSSWFEAGATSRMSTAAFVGQVYNDTAMRRHLSHEPHEDAADLFAKAEAARPEEPAILVQSRLLARTETRSRSPKLRSAERSRRAARASPRAQKDGDFDAVRSEAWFTKLVR